MGSERRYRKPSASQLETEQIKANDVEHSKPQEMPQQLISRMISGAFNPSDVVHLQRTLGNRVTGQIIQRTPDEDSKRTFASLMSFWKEQEGGKMPEKVMPPSAEGAESAPESEESQSESDDLNQDQSTSGFDPDHYNTATEFPDDHYNTGYYDDDDDDESDEDGDGSSGFSFDFGVPLMERMDNRKKIKYRNLLSIDTEYVNENKSSKAQVDHYIEMAMAKIAKDAANTEMPEDQKIKSVGQDMQKNFGWNASDVEKYLNGEKLKEGVNPVVDYVDEERREDYLITGGSPLKQDGKTFDTSAMYSKVGGQGYGIFVMGPDGSLYSNAHKVGLFHHSSFLAGLPAAAAGEWRVVDGEVTNLSDKSGHYLTTPLHMSQFLQELAGRGVNLNIPLKSLATKPPSERPADEVLKSNESALRQLDRELDKSDDDYVELTKNKTHYDQHGDKKITKKRVKISITDYLKMHGASIRTEKLKKKAKKAKPVALPTSYVDNDDDEMENAPMSYVDNDDDQMDDAPMSYVDNVEDMDDDDEMDDAPMSYVDNVEDMDDDDEMDDAPMSYIDNVEDMDDDEMDDAPSSYIDNVDDIEFGDYDNDEESENDDDD